MLEDLMDILDGMEFRMDYQSTVGYADAVIACKMLQEEMDFDFRLYYKNGGYFVAVWGVKVD